MLADEPIASLDPDSAGQVMDILQNICCEQKILMIVNLHQVGFAEKYADRIVGMAKGEIVFDSRSGELSKKDVQAIYQQENELVRT